MSSILSNSQNVLITGGHLISNNIRIEGPKTNGIDALRHRTALSALLDSTERFDPPKCAPDTRIAIIHDLMEWVTNEDEFASVMWLYGPVGSGKSALAQTIAEMCREENRLAASFFFARTTPSRSDGRLLIATLAYQLSLTFPSIRPFIRKCVEEDPTIFERNNETQMKRLIIDPVNQFASSWLNVILTLTKQYLRCFITHKPRLIVIDGLDECHDPRMQCDLLRIVGEATERLKIPIKFLISSRPESHILHIFNHNTTFQSLDFPTINLALDNDAHRDIRVFLYRQFHEIKRTHPLRSYLHELWPGPEAIRHLVRKASGQFIYASTVIKYIQSIKHRPDDRLGVILGLSPAPSHEMPFAELDALYTYIFSSVDNIQSVLQIFGALIIPRTKGDGLGNFTTPNTLERFLLFKPGDALLLLGDLLSLVSLGGQDTPIKILHASLADYFLDQSRSGRFHVDLGLTHSFLARGYLKRISNIISVYNFNPLDLLSSITPFISHCLRVSLSEELQKDLMAFDFASICKILIIRHKSWLVLNPFYLWFLVRSFFHVLTSEAFISREAKRIHTHFANQLDVLNDFLLLQLKSSAVDNYLPDLMSRFQTQQYSRPSNTAAISISSNTAQHLSLLCQLFSWDYNSSFTSDIYLRYTYAAKHCLKFIQTDLENRDLKRALRQFPSSFADYAQGWHQLEEAHLDCAITLLPLASYENNFVEFLVDFTFSTSTLTLYPEKVDYLTVKIIAYFQNRATDTAFTKIKKKWSI